MTPAILDEETIEWYSVADALPDADTTCLVNVPEADEPVWLGYWDGTHWRNVEGWSYKSEVEIGAKVTAWAAIPKGCNDNGGES